MRKWLYKKDVEPTIFKGDAIEEALANGWETRPISDEPQKAIEAVVVEKKKLKPIVKPKITVKTKKED